MFTQALLAHAEKILSACRTKGWKLATAESCTGGLIAALLTEIPGSSDVFERGFVVYANAAKRDMLHVPETVLTRHGAVSSETAQAMAEGALRHSLATLSVAVTGIAGPGGGTVEKPVGLVYLAVALRDHHTVIEKCHFAGDRAAIRVAAVARALEMLESQMKG